MEELIEKLKRRSGSHKGQNGKVGVIAGSKDYTGAPALASKAALRTGCDLTRIITSESVKDTVASYSENFIVGSYPSDYLDLSSVEPALDLIHWSDATVLGPGLGNPDSEAIKEIVSEADIPLVIDADAIKPALGANISQAVFTPHGGEAEFIEDRYGSLENFAEEESVVVVLKGSTDEIYTPNGGFENHTGTSAMTVGGTGDVLTGIIASLISQGLELDEAARLGVWVNGKAGELATEELGKGMLATDVIEKISLVTGSV